MTKKTHQRQTSKHKTKKISSNDSILFQKKKEKRTKSKPQQYTAFRHWESYERVSSYLFLYLYQQMFLIGAINENLTVYELMEYFILQKTSVQCRTHMQKMFLKFPAGSIAQTLKQMEKQLYYESGIKNLEQHREKEILHLFNKLIAHYQQQNDKDKKQKIQKYQAKYLQNRKPFTFQKLELNTYQSTIQENSLQLSTKSFQSLIFQKREETKSSVMEIQSLQENPEIIEQKNIISNKQSIQSKELNLQNSKRKHKGLFKKWDNLSVYYQYLYIKLLKNQFKLNKSRQTQVLVKSQNFMDGLKTKDQFRSRYKKIIENLEDQRNDHKQKKKIKVKTQEEKKLKKAKLPQKYSLKTKINMLLIKFDNEYFKQRCLTIEDMRLIMIDHIQMIKEKGRINQNDYEIYIQRAKNLQWEDQSKKNENYLDYVSKNRDGNMDDQNSFQMIKKQEEQDQQIVQNLVYNNTYKSQKLNPQSIQQENQYLNLEQNMNLSYDDRIFFEQQQQQATEKLEESSQDIFQQKQIQQIYLELKMVDQQDFF